MAEVSIKIPSCKIVFGEEKVEARRKEIVIAGNSTPHGLKW
jgi:hypothetical protein